MDDKDKVIQSDEFPPSSVGAPIPMLLADEHTKVVAYYVQEDEIVDDPNNERIAIVSFSSCKAALFGPPNDEAFRGHPLYSRGLRPYSSFVVEDSSWLRILRKMNEVHPYHRPENFEDYKHFILSFHDSTFECIARDFKVETILGNMRQAINVMSEKLR